MACWRVSVADQEAGTALSRAENAGITYSEKSRSERSACSWVMLPKCTCTTR